MKKDYRAKVYTVNVHTLKNFMIDLHLDYLHNQQLNMIDEAVEKSDLSDAKMVIKHIMDKK